MKKVSIIIPVYNSENTIGETLESLLKQSYAYWEAICVDDGSSDRGSEIIKQYSSKDERILFTRRASDPKGGSACRNIGAQMATGDYLIFLDSDDVLAPWCLENRVKFIENSDCDFVVFPIGYFEDDVSRYSVTNNLNSKNHILRFASGSPTWQTMQPIYRKAIFEEIGRFDERFPRYQDVEFGIRAMLQSKYLIVNDVEPDCYLRMFGNSGYITEIKAKQSILATFYLMDLLCKLNKDGKFDIALVALYVHLVSFRFKAGIKSPISAEFDNPAKKIVNENLHGINRYISRFIGDMHPSIFSQVVLRILPKCIDIIIDKNLLLY